MLTLILLLASSSLFNDIYCHGISQFEYCKLIGTITTKLRNSKTVKHFKNLVVRHIMTWFKINSFVYKNDRQEFNWQLAS